MTVVSAPEIPVTPEMAAAVEEFNCYFDAKPSVFFGIVRDMYRAMAAQAPVELVTPGELAALKERDEALAQVASLRAQMPELEYAARLSRSASGHSVDLARTMLAQRDAAEAELKTLRTRLTERDASLVKALRQRV